MNYSIIIYIIGMILKLEAAFMVLPVVTALIYGGGYFSCTLTQEEINILATYMIVEWLGQQLASVENTRMKYSGSDFKMTS